MAIQNSGTISLDRVGAEFRGPKPYKMGDHYRGGGRVPTNLPGNYQAGNPGNPGNYVAGRPGNYTPGTPGGCTVNGNWNSPSDAPQYQATCPDNTSPYPRSFNCAGTVISVVVPCGPNGPGSKCGAKWASIDRRAQQGMVYMRGCQTAPAVMNNPTNPSGNPGNPPYTNPPNPPNPSYTNPPVPINTNVPATGTIRLSNFYGARKS